MSEDVDVIYDARDGRIVALRDGEKYVLPVGLNVSYYRRGAEPVLTVNQRGEVFLKANTIIMNPDKEE